MKYIMCKEEVFDIPLGIDALYSIFKPIEATKSEIGEIKDGWLITGCGRDYTSDDKKWFRGVLANAILTFKVTSYREYENFKLLRKYKIGGTEYYQYYKTTI